MGAMSGRWAYVVFRTTTRSVAHIAGTSWPQSHTIVWQGVDNIACGIVTCLGGHNIDPPPPRRVQSVTARQYPPTANFLRIYYKIATGSSCIPSSLGS